MIHFLKLAWWNFLYILHGSRYLSIIWSYQLWLTYFTKSSKVKKSGARNLDCMLQQDITIPLELNQYWTFNTSCSWRKCIYIYLHAYVDMYATINIEIINQNLNKLNMDHNNLFGHWLYSLFKTVEFNKKSLFSLRYST